MHLRAMCAMCCKYLWDTFFFLLFLHASASVSASQRYFFAGLSIPQRGANLWGGWGVVKDLVRKKCDAFSFFFFLAAVGVTQRLHAHKQFTRLSTPAAGLPPVCYLPTTLWPHVDDVNDDKKLSS